MRGFRLGADDYVTKPFGLLELLARVNARLRRSVAGGGNGTAATSLPPPAAMRFGEIEIEVPTHTVRRRGQPVALRPKEYDLLLALVRRRGHVASRLELLREVWGYNSGVVSRTVDTHIAELRRKLEDDPAEPAYILTVRKTGYRVKL